MLSASALLFFTLSVAEVRATEDERQSCYNKSGEWSGGSVG